MYQYSGPGSQQVLDTWGISWETYMAKPRLYRGMRGRSRHRRSWRSF